MLNYRSISDLDRCVLKGVSSLPSDIDVVAGIPRSGLLVANIIALYLNKPLTTIQALCEGSVLAAGERLNTAHDDVIRSARKIAIVDDSISSGREMQRARAMVDAAGLSAKAIYGAAYAVDADQGVDFFFELCPLPRVFAWNLMHRKELETACVDIDGVLCCDPTEAENDDGPAYKRFLEQARPLFRPTFEVGALVTCRLERYRAETEAWLRQTGVRYRELVMWDLPDKRARVASGGHGAFKADVYRARDWADWFIESSAHQAQVIANLSLKPVICLETQTAHTPGMRSLVRGAVRNSPNFLGKGINRLLLRIGRSH